MPSKYGSYDIGDERLAQALISSADPKVLFSLAVLARSVFGWFNQRTTRADEYVWVASKVGSYGGKTIADIGAGVSPLPIYLARLGNHVTTVDNSSERRILGYKAELEWNGWGFFDYSQVEDGIRSFNVSACDVNIEAQSLDCLYSISVVEHLHSNIRHNLWVSMARWMKIGADLLLTVDLVPNTTELWNFEQGKPVEDPTTHGCSDSLIEELARAGFCLFDMTIKRDYPDTPRTDVAYLHFVRK